MDRLSITVTLRVALSDLVPIRAEIKEHIIKLAIFKKSLFDTVFEPAPVGLKSRAVFPICIVLFTEHTWNF